MYTTIKEWKKIQESMGDIDLNLDATLDTDAETDVNVEVESDELTLDAFKELVHAEYAKHAETLEEDAVAPEMLTDDQMEILFNVCNNCKNADTNVEVEMTGELDVEETEETEEIEEGLGDFFRGGSKEEIEAKKKEIEAKLDELTKTAEDKGYKTVKFKMAGDNSSVDFNKESALKAISKNNYLGELKILPKGDVAFIVYKEGKKGAAKLAAGTSSNTVGA